MITDLPAGLPGSFIELMWGDEQLVPGSRKLHYNPSVVPGPLQTADYAKAIFGAQVEPYDHAATEARVRLRVARQRMLAGPARFVFVLDEAVIQRIVGDRFAMARQLKHLAQAAARPYVTIRIIPFTAGPYPGVSNGFELTEIGPGMTHLYREDAGSGRFDINPPDLDEYVATFAGALAAALSEADSLDFITAAFERL